MATTELLFLFDNDHFMIGFVVLKLKTTRQIAGELNIVWLDNARLELGVVGWVMAVGLVVGFDFLRVFDLFKHYLDISGELFYVDLRARRFNIYRKIG